MFLDGSDACWVCYMKGGGFIFYRENKAVYSSRFFLLDNSLWL